MKKIFIKTYGCSFNQLDSQIIEKYLINNKYNIVREDDICDLVIINSCSVKNLSEAKLFNDIKKYKLQNKKIIVCGCVPQAEKSYLKTKLKDCSVLGVNDLDRVCEVVEETLKGVILQIVNPLYNRDINEKNRIKKEKLRLLTKSKKKQSLQAIIPINEGCLNNCTFCKTKYARGNLFSYSIKNIKKCLKKCVENGAKEIYLTSQDTACYGFDINSNLVELLKELLTIKGDYKIRIGMGNPNHFIKIIDSLLDLMKDENRIYKFLHIPVQSGSNRILNEMKRLYSVEDFLFITDKAKKTIPDITLANDLIVAYPTETKQEFYKTIDVLEKSQTNVLNFSRFWLRPNTPAQKIYFKKDFIDGFESKNRSKILKKEFETLALKNNKTWIGWQGEVLVTELGKKGTKSVIGRNDSYKPIIIKNSIDKLKIGDKTKVKIDEVTWFDFRGVVVE
ncbi:MAG: tRNA (N(6)-L-threonylcarbamoyladenosine(37)-C(2))-methylthiotransferase [Nanoarchaeota archaeon]